MGWNKHGVAVEMGRSVSVVQKVSGSFDCASQMRDASLRMTRFGGVLKRTSNDNDKKQKQIPPLRCGMTKQLRMDGHPVWWRLGGLLFFMYGNNEPHCWQGPVTSAQRVVEIAQHIQRHKPEGADTGWWDY
jgi:hypothetical protein